jgi:hypothetical protein
MVQPDAFTKFPDLRPVKSPPPLHHLWGFGLYLYGERDFDLETVSFVRTLCFCLLYIPVLPLRAYRVTPTDDGWNYLGRVPVSTPARLFGSLISLSLLGGGTYLGLEAYWNSPSVRAHRYLAEADKLEAEGQAAKAAPLLGVVAAGDTEKARLALDRLSRMIRPATKSDPEGRRAALLEAVGLQKAGRWRGTAQALRDQGLGLAREMAGSDPSGAMEILEAVGPLGKDGQADAEFRRELLEKAFAADPSNVEWASRLAVECESRGDSERCEKILTPLRARLGDREGARILAVLDARANRLDQAIPQLRSYTKDRLGRLLRAEEHLRSLSINLQKRLIKALETRRQPDFNYDAYQGAGPSGRERILIEYIERKAKADKEITLAQDRVIAESQVVPAAIELGVALIQHAQGQADARARKSLFDEAEATLLAVSRVAGESEEYQLNLAQVYYWQGKHAQGRALFDKVLTDHKRDPELLLEVASLLRRVGSNSEARKLAEEGYEKAAPGRVKSDCALVRGLLSHESEDRIRWLKLANSSDPQVSAILLKDQASEAIEKGDEKQAILDLKQAVSIYQSMPESSAMLNNQWIALNQLARLTGDRSARERAAALIAKAAALDPSNSLALHNASESLLETALGELIGPSIDLDLIKSPASLVLIGFLARDDREQQAYVARLRSHPVVNRALSMMEKVILLAPQNPSFYRSPAQLLASREDLEGLRKLLSTLEHTELDLSDLAKRARERDSGQPDKTSRRMIEGTLRLVEPILPVARAKGGATFAAAAAQAIASRIAATEFDIKVDKNATVVLAEEAVSAWPSPTSRWSLISALLARAADMLGKTDSKFAEIRQHWSRSVSDIEFFAALLSVEGPLKRLALGNPDVTRAIDLLQQSYAACPAHMSGPLSWGLLQSRHPQDASALAKLYAARYEWDRVHEEIIARLDPYDRSNTLKAYCRARMENREKDALRILQDAGPGGFPVPIGSR